LVLYRNEILFFSKHFFLFNIKTKKKNHKPRIETLNLCVENLGHR